MVGQGWLGGHLLSVWRAYQTAFTNQNVMYNLKSSGQARDHPKTTWSIRGEGGPKTTLPQGGEGLAKKPRGHSIFGITFCAMNQLHLKKRNAFQKEPFFKEKLTMLFTNVL